MHVMSLVTLSSAMILLLLYYYSCVTTVRTYHSVIDVCNFIIQILGEISHIFDLCMHFVH